MYEIRFLTGASKYLKKLKDKELVCAFKEAFGELAEDPYIGSLKNGDLAGVYGYDVYYNKINYEIAYRIYEDDGKLLVVILAGTRENFYKELKRYMK
jgi:mRNA interferase RelE/StbE